MTIPVRNALATASISRNWRDTYDPFSSGMLNPHNPGATTVNPTLNTAQTTPNVPFTS